MAAESSSQTEREERARDIGDSLVHLLYNTEDLPNMLNQAADAYVGPDETSDEERERLEEAREHVRDLAQRVNTIKTATQLLTASFAPGVPQPIEGLYASMVGAETMPYVDRIVRDALVEEPSVDAIPDEDLPLGFQRTHFDGFYVRQTFERRAEGEAQLTGVEIFAYFPKPAAAV